MQFNEFFTIEQRMKSFPPSKFKDPEALITPQSIDRLFKRGIWISSFFYYYAADGRLFQARSQVPHTPKTPNPDDIHEFLMQIRRFHILEILYEEIYGAYPVVQPVILSLLTEPPKNVGDPYEYIEEGGSIAGFVDITNGTTPEESREIQEDLISINDGRGLVIYEALKENSVKPTYATGYEVLKYLLGQLTPVITSSFKAKILLFYKRILYLMSKKPVQFSLLGTDLHYLKIVQAANFCFLPKDQSMLYPSSDLKDMNQNFTSWYGYEWSFFHYLTWEETYCLRLVSKGYYKMIKEKLSEYKVYLIMENRKDRIRSNGVEQYTYTIGSDSDSLERRDSRCITCHCIRCICEGNLMDTHVDYSEILADHFPPSERLTLYFSHLSKVLPQLSFPLAIAMGTIYSRQNKLAYKVNYEYVTSQLPVLLMEEVKMLFGRRLLYKTGYITLNGMVISDRRRLADERKKIKTKRKRSVLNLPGFRVIDQ